MPKKPKALSRQQLIDWDNHCADVKGEFGPVEPDHINIARTVDETIKQFGLKEGLEHAASRAEYAFHEEDRDDWKEVARLICERKAAARP